MMKRLINILLQTLLLCCFTKTIAGGCPSSCRCDATILQVSCSSIANASDLINIAEEIDNNTKEFILKGNNLTNFEFDKAPLKLSDLLILDLSDNSFAAFPTGLADKFPNLEVLKLPNNQMDELSTDDFKGLDKLTKITFNNNNLRSLGDGVFQNLANLKQLVIKSNQITTVSKDAFKGLSKLVNLDLSSNQISELQPGLFDHFSDKGLSVSFPMNKLKLLPNGLFNKLKEIKMLELSSNQISSIGDEVFNGVTLSLNLYQNSLQELPINSFLNSSIKIIQVLENPIKCVCNLRKLFPKFKNKILGKCKDENTTLDFSNDLSTYDQDELSKALCTRCELKNTCMNGGKCIPIGKTNLTCECTGGFFGSNCQYQSFCLQFPCKHGGTCALKNVTDYQCFCKDDYYGKDCELVHDKGGLSEAAVAGIILGILFLVVIIIVIIIFSKKRCQQRQNKDPVNPSELTSLKQNNPDA